jgi:acyl transferase domain-containing protein
MTEQPVRDHDIAIVAMTGRFPGAANVAEFWENLKGGVESITLFSDDELRANWVRDELINHPDYVKSRPVLEDVRGFDPGLFGFSPAEATFTDPQLRIFLECVWEALELAGYGCAESRGRVGVFAGMNISTYLHAMYNFGVKAAMARDPYELIIGNDKDALPTMVAYRLSLTGPAVGVQTFCSTSATAIHLACQSLRLGECEMALAGGVCIRVPERTGYLFVEGGMVSPDGHVRTFDAKGRGGVFGDGSAVVLLKPLRRALADRDTVLAVIRGSAMNNDGSAKFSYTAPSVVGQAAAVVAALADANVAPRDVSYVEAHGTATELGDPIEVAALTRAFKSAEAARSGSELRDRQYCAIGSVKTNIGHLDRAASVAGLIKVVEGMRNELIPASLNFETPNPEIDFAKSPFYVAGSAIPWRRQPGRPRLAGVNGLGMGGTNVHIVVQEAPDPAPRPAPRRRWQVLPVSAKSPEAVTDYCGLMARHLAIDAGQELDDTAYTLQVGRALFPHRRVVIADSAAGAAGGLAGEAVAGASLLARHDSTRGRATAFLFSGVGEHYAGMAGDLYRTEPTFRHHLDQGQALLSEHSTVDVVPALTGEREDAGPAHDLAALMGRRGARGGGGALSDTAVAQPAVFLAEHALARTLMDWGITPSLVLGYSVGEYVAACLAGVLTLPDAVRLVAHRAALIAGLPGGAMLAVGATWEDLRAQVPDLARRGLDLSAVNPNQVVVGGPGAAVADLAGLLRERGLACRELDTTHAFHTRMLEPAAAELTRWVAGNVTLRAPALPYVSNVTGRLATAELVTDPAYWARHMCQPVRFAAGLATALGRKESALIEVGPGRSLGAMARSHPDCDRSRWPLVVGTMPGADESAAGDRVLATALGELWLTGVTIDWNAYHRLHQDRAPGRVPLPTYPFQRKQYWFDTADEPGPGAAEPDTEALLSEYEKLPLLPESQWLNVDVWRERAQRPPMPDPGGQWVVFTDVGGADAIAGPLATTLTGEGRQVTLVRPGERFTAEPDGYRIRPGSIEDTLELFATLKRDGHVPDRVVHLWTLRPGTVGETVRSGMHTLVAISRAAHEIGFGDWKLDVVTAGTCQVTGDEPIVAARATARGPCTILPVEYPGSAVRVIDLVDDAATPAADVLAELRTEPGNQTVALRSGRRWTPDFERLELAAAGQPVPEPVPPLRTGGVYLITGGLGGIGMALAERLGEAYQARLVLFGRTPVPPRGQWEAILADPAATDEVRRRIEGLVGLEAKGIEFALTAGDVASVNDVRRAVGTALEQFGALHGVLHAAGVPGMGMMQFKTISDMDRVLAPKVAGTLALAEALSGVPLDFLVLFSSVASVTGALGQADYSAANAFLDAFARSGMLPHTRLVSIGWGEWTWNGWAAGLEGYEPVLREFYNYHRRHFGISFDAGWRCLLQALARPEPYLVVNTQDFAASVESSRHYTIHDIQAGARAGRGNQRHPRPDLSTPYVAPSTPAEVAIAEIWGEALGIEQVGVSDNFFDLGGNSLVGVGIISAVRRALDLDHLPAHVIYQAPTVAALATAALAVAGAGTPAGTSRTGAGDRARQRQQRLARRRERA